MKRPRRTTKGFEKAFGKVLRDHRARAELTQEVLAAEAGLSRNYVSMLERGERSPTLYCVFALADALGVHPTRLVAEVADLLERT